MGEKGRNMMDIKKVRIVTDSSADPFALAQIATAAAPLSIRTDFAEYVDTPELVVHAMNEALATYKGKSGTACPSIAQYIDAFGGAEYVFCITITAKLSGSYNVARSAAREYEEQNPGCRVCLIDSESTGPAMRLLAERIEEMVLDGMGFDEISEKILAFRQKTELLFLLESMHNLANNGRVSRTLAKIAGLLGIRMLGRAVEGEIKPVAKPRGEENGYKAILSQMEELSFDGKRVRISHCENEGVAKKLEKLILESYPAAEIKIQPCGGLCAFYAERGGLLVGFETK